MKGILMTWRKTFEKNHYTNNYTSLSSFFLVFLPYPVRVVSKRLFRGTCRHSSEAERFIGNESTFSIKSLTRAYVNWGLRGCKFLKKEGDFFVKQLHSYYTF
tara:strand:- start:1585 stop:1890 length:306 start_codon:yes stop_codon:yes gene_type:complete